MIPRPLRQDTNRPNEQKTCPMDLYVVEIKGGGSNVKCGLLYVVEDAVPVQTYNFEAVAGCRKGWGIILISFL